MLKRISAVLLLGSLFINFANAFSIENALEEQIDQYSGTVLIDDYVALQNDGIELQNLFINPNFPTERDMYLSTSKGVYLNRQYDATFTLDENLTEVFPAGMTELKFAQTYVANGIMLAYDKNNIYISNNRGDSWLDYTPELSEEIMFADFGPNYAQNEQVYIITSTGLYRLDVNTKSLTKVLDSTAPGSMKLFRYVTDETVDNIYYVVDGNQLLKTENYGDSWFNHDFESNIKDFKIDKQTDALTYLKVLTENNEIFYATDDFSFYMLDLPEEITAVNFLGDVIGTDQGLYITYTDGDTWEKLEYDSSNTSNIKDMDFIKDGVSDSLYVINGSTLYRDAHLDEIFSEYMTGIEGSEGYLTEGSVISTNLLDLNTETFAENYQVEEASLSADGDLNGQTIMFYMTADGENWEEVTLDENHVFEFPGRDLRWKAVLETTDTAVTPVLRSVIVDFGMEETGPVVDETLCAGFPDIQADDPVCPAITYVKEQGIFEGYPDGSFMPDQAINRAETVKVITEGFDIPMLTDDGTDLGFNDVITGEWYMGYLRTAKESGVIEGYPDGSFKPEQTVNYVEMLKIFLETAKAELGTPAQGAAWYQKYVDYAVLYELVQYEQLDAGMKRADVAELFYEWSLQH